MMIFGMELNQDFHYVVLIFTLTFGVQSDLNIECFMEDQNVMIGNVMWDMFNALIV